jgi:hypothetical protein
MAWFRIIAGSDFNPSHCTQIRFISPTKSLNSFHFEQQIWCLTQASYAFRATT